jgi:hypothetical protein
MKTTQERESIHGSRFQSKSMNPRILIIEELYEGEFSHFDGYAVCCDIFGYKYRVCHNLKQLPQFMEAFDPDIVFWILQDYTKYEVYNINKMRLHNKNLKIVLAYDFEMYSVGEDIADFHLRRTSIVPDEFQKIITELLFTSSTSNIEQRSLHQLSDNALREVAAEQMWPGEKSYMESLMERKQRGDLDENEQITLEKLLHVREQLLKRKSEAASILIDRGYSGSVEELIAESKRLD